MPTHADIQASAILIAALVSMLAFAIAWRTSHLHPELLTFRLIRNFTFGSAAGIGIISAVLINVRLHLFTIPAIDGWVTGAESQGYVVTAGLVASSVVDLVFVLIVIRRAS